ncbi:hypothetical protein [Streptomyces sp. NPDC058989]|uniref:hypothetical protein n=1 Tax=Streptomyces sp. NPDC058989 TaxID=3346686 RepID=UPI0036C06670
MLDDDVERHGEAIRSRLEPAAGDVPADGKFELVQDSGQIWLIYVVMLLYGLLFSFVDPAQAAFLRVLVPEDQLADANALTQTVRQRLRLISPIAEAGLFAALGAHAVVVANVVLMLAAVAFPTAVRFRESTPEYSGDSWHHEITEGVRHLAWTAVLRQLAVACALTMVAMDLAEKVGLAVVDDSLVRLAVASST